MNHPYHLSYNTPADCWQDALPLGNGRLGAMVYGRSDIERIQLNDDSLWYGTFADRNNAALREKLPEIRNDMLSGNIRHAEELILQYMVGAPSTMRHYTNLGELDLALNQHLPFAMGGREPSQPPQQYSLDLDLMTGILQMKHKAEGVSYEREMFVSHEAQALCICLIADTPQSMNLDMKLDRIAISDAVIEDDRRPGRKAGGGGWPAPFADIIHSYDDKTFLMQGRDAGVEFAVAFRVACNGELINTNSQLLARNCSEAVIYLASATSNRAADVTADVLARLDAAEKAGYSALRQAHIVDFSAFMERCMLDLGPAPAGTIDTRLSALRQGNTDPALAALYFQYGRYLIVSGSREDSAALNLQGIWNAEFTPMWDSKYTVNINLQMNYWPAEIANLSELHLPFMDLLETMHPRGCETARVMYGMRGMVCHHNTDFYGDCAPQDWYMASTPWVTGGAWLGLHVWEHYLYTKDTAILQRMYPILKDMCLFYEDFLIERDGKLATCPSVSPENRYILPDGYDTPICIAPAMDNQILREFFGACVKIQEILGLDEDYSATLNQMIQKLPADQIGSKGQLLEWDQEYPELTPGMGHVSHLFAAYPGSSINWADTPDLLRAVGKSLALREENGAGEGGWPLAWYISLHARLLDPEQTDRCIHKMLADSATRSFLNAHGVFQIDGNLGAVAGMAECLMQSHIALHFLPALPASWKNGRVSGLISRGSHSVSLQWEKGALLHADVAPRFDGAIEVVGDELEVRCGDQLIPTQKTQLGFSFDGQAGKEYRLVPRSAVV